MSERERGLWVSETFVSIQGEGPSQGAPAAFLRLGRCNLSCGFCDTPYTWDAERFDLATELHEWPLERAAAWWLKSSPGRVIVTGGEPLIQHVPLAALLAEVDLARRGRGEPVDIVEIETNGTVEPSARLLERVDQFNVSPKLSNSGEPRARAIRLRSLGIFAASPRTYFKFVIGSAADAEEAMDLVRELSVPLERVVFMPLAASVVELRSRQGEVAQLALAARVRFGSRLHLELFGGGRGV